MNSQIKVQRLLVCELTHSIMKPVNKYLSALRAFCNSKVTKRRKKCATGCPASPPRRRRQKNGFRKGGSRAKWEKVNGRPYAALLRRRRLLDALVPERFEA